MLEKKSVEFHLGNAAQNCGICQNWGMDGKCSVLGAITPRSGVCKMFLQLESDAGIPADLGVLNG